MAHACVFLSDGHSASDYGLWPPDAPTDTEGGRHVHNFIQAYLWECWQHLHQVWLPSVCGNLPRVGFLGGDLVDGDHPKSPVCTRDMNLQAQGAEMTFGPFAQTCERVYAAAGTPFHGGQCLTWDNEVARRLGCIPNPEGADDTRYARWIVYPVAVDGVVFNLAHHGRGSRVQSSRMTPLVNEYITAGTDYFERDWPRPTWIVRGHTHLYRYAPFQKANVVFLPGFQAKTPHAWSLETGAPFDIGAVVVYTDAGRSWMERKLYAWPAPRVEAIGWQANPEPDSP